MWATRNRPPDEQYRPAAHHWIIDRELRACAREQRRYLMINMPPGAGKSEIVSRWFPPWWMARNPAKSMLAVSHKYEYARDEYGRPSFQIFRDHACPLFDVRIDPKLAMKGAWATRTGGRYRVAGIDACPTGFRPHVIVVDDPTKNHEEVSSKHQRDKQWTSFRGDFEPRREPPGITIVVMTRFHEDDLCGRLLKRDGTIEEGGKWKHLKFQAIAEEADELGRERGDPLWPEKYTQEIWSERIAEANEFKAPPDMPEEEKLSALLRGRIGQSLYQQNPRPAAGTVIPIHLAGAATETDIEGHTVFELQPLNGERRRYLRSECSCIQTIDTAMKTKTQNDFTAILTTFLGPKGEMIFHRMLRRRIEVPEQYPTIMAERARYAGEIRYQACEDKASGTGIIQQARNDGIPMRVLKAKTDKLLRADALVLAYEAGLVYHLVGAPWLGEFEDELLAFPNGTFDDQADVAAYAAQEAMRKFGSGGGVKAVVTKSTKPIKSVARILR